MKVPRECGKVVQLHVGCGTRKLPPPWINIDIRQEVEPDRLVDAMELDHAFGAASVDEIYACHLLEHFREPENFLGVCRAVLKPYGTLRIAVPNTSALIEAYWEGGIGLSRLRGMLWGGHHYEGDVHHWGWDFETLAELLRKCSFFDIRPWRPEDVFPDDYDDFSYARIYNMQGVSYPASLNVEATRS